MRSFFFIFKIYYNSYLEIYQFVLFSFIINSS
nr:MAG TPA: hypothetical protein [Bacteriophage sp.]